MEFLLVIFGGIVAGSLAIYILPKIMIPQSPRYPIQPKRVSTPIVKQPHPVLPPQKVESANGPSNALKIATTYKYYPKKLLNHSEKQLYALIQRLIAEHAPGRLILHAQVPLGEILHTKNKYAYGTINFKRVDLLITDIEFNPLLAIEYNGSGHYDKTALERDEIKRSALESANIRCLSIRENADPAAKIVEEMKHLVKF